MHGADADDVTGANTVTAMSIKTRQHKQQMSKAVDADVTNNRQKGEEDERRLVGSNSNEMQLHQTDAARDVKRLNQDMRQILL